MITAKEIPVADAKLAVATPVVASILTTVELLLIQVPPVGVVVRVVDVPKHIAEGFAITAGSEITVTTLVA